jgi:hypothetical protein
VVKLAEVPLEIRIVGLNRDLTRKTGKVETLYEVYFDLSGVPSPSWAKMLTREWKRLNPTEPRLWTQVSVERRYLVMHWPPQEIAQKHLPVLKQAVAATNKSHKRFVAKNGSDTKTTMRSIASVATSRRSNG